MLQLRVSFQRSPAIFYAPLWEAHGGGAWKYLSLAGADSDD
jgi:hypothetical protein